MRITESDLKAALPDVKSTMTFSELASSVEVQRDQWGIPHIKADNEQDLYFAQGFVTAQDRLWQMDLDRKRALGRWSEIAGPGGITRDRLLRAGGMGRTAKLDYEKTSAPGKAMLQAYAGGVNAFIRTSKSLPIEYKLVGLEPEEWSAHDCITAYKMRNSLLGTFEGKLLRTKLAATIGTDALVDLIKGYPSGHLLTVPPGGRYEGPELDGLDDLLEASRDANWLGEIGAGSNAWSISGGKSETGLPMVAGDSHRALDTPSVYYQVHLACPEFSAIGHSVPGMPGTLHFCHNEYVAWGMTYGSADTQDLFIEHFREGDSGREYEFKGEWRAAEVLNETLHVRGADPVETEVTITHHGPVVAGDPATGNGITIADPGLIAGTKWVDAARDAMHSKSVLGLHQAFAEWTDRVNNYAVADVDGNFGYLHEGKIPIRGEASGWRAVPGWTGEHEWSGYIPHDEMPKAINPEQGYAVTCNQRVAGSDFPYYVGLYFAAHHRAERIIERIGELRAGTATIEDMAAIHAERISSPALKVRDALLALDPNVGRRAEAFEILRSWDGSIDRELVGPSISGVARSFITIWQITHLFGDSAEEVFDGGDGGEGHRRLVVQRWMTAMENGDDAVWPAGHGWPDILGAALDRTIETLAERLGNDMNGWVWGAIHHTKPVHPLSEMFPDAAKWLNPPSVRAHGDADTPLAGVHLLDLPYAVKTISVNRYIFDPSSWKNSRWIVPLGSSGHPASPHYSDQATAWSNVEYIPQMWDWDDIRNAAESTQVFEPA